MYLREIVNHLECDVLVSEHLLDLTFEHAFASDLMSDVLAFVEHETLLVTGLVNNQVIRTAEMLDLKAILFVRGKCPDAELIAMAAEQDMVLLTTKYTMYTTAGILYAKGLKGLTIEN